MNNNNLEQIAESIFISEAIASNPTPAPGVPIVPNRTQQPPAPTNQHLIRPYIAQFLTELTQSKDPIQREYGNRGLKIIDELISGLDPDWDFN